MTRPGRSRATVALVLAVVATWFVDRPASGAGPRGERGSAHGAVRWSAVVQEGPWDLVADAHGVVVTTGQHSVHELTPSGAPRWRAEVDDLAHGQPAIGADVAVVGGTRSVTALERRDGALRWRRAVAEGAHSLAVADGLVLVGDDSGTLAAFDVATGTPRWSVRYPGALWSASRVDLATGSVVATWHQTTAPAVRVLDLRTGALRWEARTERYTAAPTVREGVVVLAVGDGERHARVEARDLASGALRWQTPVPASFEEAIEPAVAAGKGGVVAVVDHFGVVTVLDLATGALRWQHDLVAAVLTTRVVVTARRVAVTSHSGVLSVLDRADGHLVAQVSPRRLGGFPVAVVASPWRGRSGAVLLALRLRDWGVQLRSLP